MFWDTIGTEYIESGKELTEKLAKPDVTLRTIVEDPNCLMEIRSDNEELLNYFKKEAVFRELFDAVLCPNVGDTPIEKEQYGYTYRCCEVLALGARDFFTELSKYEDLANKLTDFLSTQSGNLNHLTVSFYCKVVLSFLAVETYPFLKLLEESRFLEFCMESLEFCAVFELLCSIVNCLPDAKYRKHVKQWYVRNEFAHRLLDTLSDDRPSEIHENGAALWAEFVKSLREVQQRIELDDDPLLDSLQSEENVCELLARMFPTADQPDEHLECSPSIVVNGCYVLNTLLETNIIKDSPAALIQRELYQSANTSAYSAQFELDTSGQSTNESAAFPVLDAKRVVETHCAEYSARFVRFIVDGLADENVLYRSDDALIACAQVIVNLLNTNFLPTHCELLKTFALTEDTHFCRLVEFVRYQNSSFSVFNSLLDTMILYILYSSTGAEKPLLTFLLKDYDLPNVICSAVADDQLPILPSSSHDAEPAEKSAAAEAGDAAPAAERPDRDCVSASPAGPAAARRALSKLELISKRTFFLKLANHITRAQNNSANGSYVCAILKSSPNFNRWEEFYHRQLEQFANRNRSDQVLSSTARSSNAIEIDDVSVDEIENGSGRVFASTSSSSSLFGQRNNSSPNPLEMSFFHTSGASFSDSSAGHDIESAANDDYYDDGEENEDDEVSETYRRLRSLEQYLQSEDDELAKCKNEFDAKFAVAPQSAETAAADCGDAVTPTSNTPTAENNNDM